MRIAVSAVSLGPDGGVELSTFQVGRELVRRGHELHVFHMEDGALREQYEAFATLHAVPTLYLEARSALADVARFSSAARTFRHVGGDVVWLNRFEQIFWGQTVARGSGAALVAHLRHHPNFRWTSGVSRGVRHFLAVSEYVRDEFVAAGVAGERITVAHNAVHPDDYPPGGPAELVAARGRLGIDPQAQVFLYYGRLSPDKGVHTLVEAWNRVLPQLPDGSVLLLVGKEADAAPGYLAEILSAADGDVRWAPKQVDVVPYLHSADVVVVPSEWQEPFGRVVVEGLSSGRPVIASAVGGIPEILAGGFEHLLFPAGDADALGQRMLSLVGWRNADRGLQQRCVEVARSRFSFESLVDTVERTLRDAQQAQGRGIGAAAAQRG